MPSCDMCGASPMDDDNPCNLYCPALEDKYHSMTSNSVFWDDMIADLCDRCYLGSQTARDINERNEVFDLIMSLKLPDLVKRLIMSFIF